MNRVHQLLRNYERFVALPWDHGLAGPQKVWFAVYDKMDERRLRARLDEFELATKQAKHGWHLCDITDALAEWLASDDYREAYFRSPADLESALGEFLEHVAGRVRAVLNGENDQAVVAVCGIAGLFGFMKTSELVDAVKSSILGRLLVFFPGKNENNTYRLLDARDGWNYLAVPITAHTGGHES